MHEDWDKRRHTINEQLQFTPICLIQRFYNGRTLGDYLEIAGHSPKFELHQDIETAPLYEATFYRDALMEMKPLCP